MMKAVAKSAKPAAPVERHASASTGMTGPCGKGTKPQIWSVSTTGVKTIRKLAAVKSSLHGDSLVVRGHGADVKAERRSRLCLAQACTFTVVARLLNVWAHRPWQRRGVGEGAQYVQDSVLATLRAPAGVDLVPIVEATLRP